MCILKNGTITAMTFAVIDVQKEQDMPNDSHGSKVIVVPFAGNKLTEFASRKDELDDGKVYALLRIVTLNHGMMK